MCGIEKIHLCLAFWHYNVRFQFFSGCFRAKFSQLWIFTVTFNAFQTFSLENFVILIITTCANLGNPIMSSFGIYTVTSRQLGDITPLQHMPTYCPSFIQALNSNIPMYSMLQRFIVVHGITAHLQVVMTMSCQFYKLYDTAACE